MRLLRHRVTAARRICAAKVVPFLAAIDTERFPEVGNFLSYSRLVRCEHESAGKKKGSGGKKIGNAHLKWAFSEAVCLLVRNYPAVKGWQARKGSPRCFRASRFPTSLRLIGRPHGVRGQLSRVDTLRLTVA